MQAMDVGGCADDCARVPSDKWASEPVLHYMLSNEKPLILLKSRKDEFLFTSHGLICSDGESATSPKRRVTRTNWSEARVGNVQLETAGLVDLDCEVGFDFQRRWKIEFKKSEIESAKLVFRCLDAIANRQLKNERLFAMEKLAYEKMAGGFNAHLLPGADAATFTDAITNASSKWALRMAELYQPDSYEKEMQAILLT